MRLFAQQEDQQLTTNSQNNDDKKKIVLEIVGGFKYQRAQVTAEFTCSRHTN